MGMNWLISQANSSKTSIRAQRFSPKLSKYLTKKRSHNWNLTLESPFTTRESVKHMKDAKKWVNNPPCLVKHVIWNICPVTKHGGTQRELMWFVRLIQTTIIVRFPGEGHIFSENVMFYSSLKTCNEWVSAYSLGFWIYLSFLVMLILRVQSLGSRLIAG